MTHPGVAKVRDDGKMLRLTNKSRNDHNHGVVRLWRALVSLLIVPCMVLASVSAPEHVHAADASHPNAVVHRHSEPHRHFESHHDLEWHDHFEPLDHDVEPYDDAAVSHDEGQVIWLDVLTILQATHIFGGSPAILPDDSAGSVPTPASWTATVADDASPPHGPPRLTESLRAPPIPAV